MMKEELEKEAEESSKKAFCIAHTHEDELIYRNGYFAGAEPREKRIAELEQQIARMKAELHRRLVNPPCDGRDCLDMIVALDSLWQFGEEFYKEIKEK